MVTIVLIGASIFLLAASAALLIDHGFPYTDRGYYPRKPRRKR